MIAIDTNILIYAHRGDSPLHDSALQAMDRLVASGRRWCVVWQCVHEFLSITTHPRIYNPPSTLDESLSEVENWRRCPSFQFIAEGPTHWQSLERLLRQGRIAGPKVHDARIAAVCLQHGVEKLWSVDRDFSRFPKLAVENPLL